MSGTGKDYPGLSAHHLRGARLFANRSDMLAGLSVPQGGVVAELGVMTGDFSEIMIRTLQPRKFVAFDLFTAHTVPQIWSKPSSQVFAGLSHLDFYRRRFASLKERLVIEVGLTRDTLPKYANGEFDLVYIDAGHDYANVKSDAEWSARMIRQTGLLIFNDYVVFDHIGNSWFGIVPVVNTMIVERGWHVVGLALHREMYCDIAIKRDPTRGTG